ncbi:tetracycline resistance MFS efflux pump [Listeria welshimeri]|uniref:Tetracycline resistance MFS efflux pump n=2 Tax=Listeria welshimeri TaxID=1643 RepID=A0A7X0T5W3_LISWE|nr:tetracycline resistance MFS efflux pump [Listeria welshimeri]MBC1323147.1 tetracycline resistance MFS efflux pump [Listeria welshimeri]MBC1339774.1 tetracycline resistance MFS efflux pump [Listeria welshimeri]MBC1345947.1 tetracycline resistance MFS efflux pump [Listeria welshimeri]MBC1348498.1 tetracycline resistance MFS efflux pump [Listeria welshimeri]MBC1360510.1 tetracycline resistance MFS efflux pump [Listeria welshimeri]
MFSSKTTSSLIDIKTLLFGLIAVFLCGMGFSIIMPVVPFLVAPYVNNSSEQALMVTLLTSVYALCVFFAAPGLGALSDRFGRRPVLLLCFIGSAIGYFIFGLGGALWVLFLGRIIEGITGGSISTLFAFFADITPQENRTKYFGWVSAAAGAGAALGPAFGGFIAHFGYAMPFFFGAAITLLNFLFGYFYMPESLKKEHRLKSIPLMRLNPFSQLLNILTIKNLGRLLISGFFIWVPNGSLQAVMSQFAIDSFSWKPVLIGMMFSIMGIQDILSQAFIMPKLLLKLTDKQIAIFGMIAEIIGYTLIAASSIFAFAPLLIIGMFIFGFGDSIFGPSFNGMVSKSASASEQGRIQGGSQAIQSLARIIGPIIGGQIYITLGHAAPAVMGIILIIAAVFILSKRTRLAK